MIFEGFRGSQGRKNPFFFVFLSCIHIWIKHGNYQGSCSCCRLTIMNIRHSERLKVVPCCCDISYQDSSQMSFVVKWKNETSHKIIGLRTRETQEEEKEKKSRETKKVWRIEFSTSAGFHAKNNKSFETTWVSVLGWMNFHFRHSIGFRPTASLESFARIARQKHEKFIFEWTSSSDSTKFSPFSSTSQQARRELTKNHFRVDYKMCSSSEQPCLVRFLTSNKVIKIMKCNNFLPLFCNT